MTKDLIKKNYQKKIKLFNYYNKKYYDENISEITDSNFDQLKIRVALNTLNNIMLILLEERNHVIDPDTDEDINRVPSRESINQTQSFKRQLVTRIGIVRDNIGYLLDPRNANVIGNPVQAAQAGILGQ